MKFMTHAIVPIAVALCCGANVVLAQDPHVGRAIELRGASKHPMKYYVSFPDKYKQGQDVRRWPVLVCVAGADSLFRHRLENYMNVRSDVPFIVIAPCTFSNTNAIEGPIRELYRQLYTDAEIREAEAGRLAWDEAGLLAVLDDLRNDSHSEDRAYITGFSGGGILTYQMLLKHPNRVHAAVAVCANYFGDPSATSKESPLSDRDARIPVRLLIGELDPMQESLLPSMTWLLLAIAGVGAGLVYVVWRRTRSRWWAAMVVIATGLVAALLIVEYDGALDPQSRAALQRLRERGYRDVEVITVPGMGHEPATERVVAIFSATRH